MGAKIPPDPALAFAFNAYKDRCKRQNKYWGLTREDLGRLIHKPCHYCKAPPGNVLSNRKSFYAKKCRYQGVDRVDNRKGYTPENCIPCCGKCNSIKGALLTHEEMRATMRAILRVRKKVPTRRKSRSLRR